MSEGFTGIKDVDKLILNNMDTRTFLNTYQIKNKYIHSLFTDNIFRDRIEKEFPRIVFKSFETWKQFYFDVIYWVNLLKEKFNFESHDFRDHPKKYYSFINELIKWVNSTAEPEFVKGMLNNMLREAIKIGYIDLIKFIIDKGASDYQYAMDFAASVGNMEAFEYFRNNYLYLNLHKALYIAKYTENPIFPFQVPISNTEMINHIQNLINKN